MATGVKLRLCFFAGVLFLASISVALGEFETDHCLAQCDELKGDVDEYADCASLCELNQRGRQPGRVSPRREFELCQSRCRSQEHGEQQRRCQQRCQQQLREREGSPEEDRRDPEREREEQRRRERERRERERERERGRGHDHGRGRGRDENSRDPEREREEKRREQERREREREGRGRERERGWEERQSREEERERERHRGKGGRDDGENQGREIRHHEEQEQRYNPYYFHEQRFQSRFRSDQGHIRVLEKFSDRSELLKGIKNQRFSVLEARPQTFVIPHHLDGESVLLVVRGKATITLVWQEKRETKRVSHNLETGDVMTVPTGTTCYLINHGNENLQVVKLVQPVNAPGEYKEYFAAGGETQAYYSVFSTDVLEAALNIPRDQLERIFRRRRDRQEVIIKASQEHIKSLSQRVSSTKRHGGGGARSPIKLQSQSPLYNNKFGQMYEVCPDDFPQLRNADIAVALTEVKQGGMMVPHFNTRSTWVLFVAEGTGSFEMACPHLHGGEWQRRRGEDERHRGWEEQQGREERSGQFQQVTGRLTPGGVLIIPAGHPIAVIASRNENLRLVGFGINGLNNQRHFLAGKENIMNEIEQEAKELAFDIEGKQVEQIFKSQKESFFTEGPEGDRRRSSEEKTSTPLMSVLNFVGHI